MYFNDHAKDAYNKMVKSGKMTFEQAFGRPATPENMQEVINAVNLSKYVKTALTGMDGVDPGANFHLPPVNKVNVGDMTLLLMSGIKTMTEQLGVFKPKAAPEAGYGNAAQKQDDLTQMSQGRFEPAPEDAPKLPSGPSM